MPTDNCIKAGVMGWPIKYSLSPRLHGYWLKQNHIDGIYNAMPVEPEQLSDKLRDLYSQKITGVNLTIPHKEMAFKIVHHIDPLARRVGAINTVVVGQDGKLTGMNTDVFGFTENLRQGGYKPHGAVTMLGAGGAARAALVALLDMGITDIRLMNRNRERAESLANELSDDKIHAHSWGDHSALTNTSLLINATSLGLAGQPPLDMDLETLSSDAMVTDMVYVPLKTDLLNRAEARGHKIIDGLGMLLHQARPAFKAFYGIDPVVSPELRDYVISGMVS
jgi:shikimate dehydrogenase